MEDGRWKREEVEEPDKDGVNRARGSKVALKGGEKRKGKGKQERKKKSPDAIKFFFFKW